MKKKTIKKVSSMRENSFYRYISGYLPGYYYIGNKLFCAVDIETAKILGII